MRISDILKSKSSQDIISISPKSSIATAAEMLSERRIGSLIVSNDGGKTLTGILSERDIVRRLGTSGPECMELEVAELMTANVKTIEVDAASQKALEIMTEGKFRHMPVVEGGEIIGMISIGDVVAARLKQIENENAALNDMISGAAY